MLSGSPGVGAVASIIVWGMSVKSDCVCETTNLGDRAKVPRPKSPIPAVFKFICLNLSSLFRQLSELKSFLNSLMEPKPVKFATMLIGEERETPVGNTGN